MTESIDISALIPADKREQINATLTWASDVREVVITNNEEHQRAGETLVEVSTAIKTLEGDRAAIMAPYRKAIYGAYGEVLRALENADAVLRLSVSDWAHKKDCERLEAQKKLELEAAEARRKVEEKAAKEREKAEALREAGKEAQAEKAEAKAQIAKMQAQAIAAPIVEGAAKAEGIGYRQKYVVDVENRAEALKALAADPTLSRFLEIDVKGLERWVASLGGEGVPLPKGLRISVERNVVVRGKK
jgi:hypothetical protein